MANRLVAENMAEEIRNQWFAAVFQDQRCGERIEAVEEFAAGNA